MNSQRLAVTVFLVSAAAYGNRVEAQAPYAEKATVYYSTLVRAMDECVGPNITVVNPGATGGCAQQNVSSSNSLDLDSAAVKLYRTRDGIYMTLRAVTSTPISLQLTFRTTNELGLPAGTSKTYEDYTIMCGDSSTGTEALVCPPLHMKPFEGRVYLKQRLSDCLVANGLNPLLGKGNVEILDSALISCATMPAQTGARQGILQDK
jgi:hypothetical protein